MSIAVGKSLRINRPDFFSDPGFVEYLNLAHCATWHQAGDGPGEWSDVFVAVDPSCNGEGPDAGSMPDWIWEEIVKACRVFLGVGGGVHHIVWISNIEEVSE
jgi:hypothetical protein